MGSIFGKAYDEREAGRYAQEDANRRAQAKANQERGLREDERLRARVRADLKAAEAARAAEAAELARMTPAQLAAREARAQTHLPPPGPGPSLPRGYWLAVQDIRQKDKAEEIERQEREQDLPARRDKWDAEAQKIEAALADATAEAQRRCVESEQAARSRAESERAELGKRPELEALEAVAG